MSLFRKDRKPSVGRRLAEAAMAVGVLLLIAGIVSAFVVAGVYGVHASLARNEDPNADRVAPPKPPPPPREEARRPAPPPPPPPVAAPSAEIAAAPPPPPRPKAKPSDPSRIDEEGFIKYWLILGPIHAEKEMAGAKEIHAARVPDEAAMRPRADQRIKVRNQDLVWKRWRSPDYALDFKKALEGKRGEHVLGYAVCYLHSPEERRDVKLFIGSNDQGKVWLNGREVLVHDKPRSLTKDNDVVSGLTLRKGENVVVLKVANEGGNWQGCLRFGDKSGTPLVDLHVTSTPR